MGRSWKMVAFVCLTAAIASPAWANDIQNARVLGLGGAGRAFCPSNGSLSLNPAGMAIGRAYHVETLYGYVPTDNGHIAGGSIIDSVTAPVAMGLGFTYTAWDPRGEDRSEYDVRLGAAYYISRLLAVGLTVKYLYADTSGHGPLVDDLFEGNGDELLNTVSLDVGATLTIGRYFSLAAVGYNLTNTGSANAPLELGVGMALTIRSLLVVADMLVDFTSFDETLFRVMGGAEYLVAHNWPIRIGYRWDQYRDAHAISGGFGYVSQRFGIELSIRQDVAASERLQTALVLSLRYFAN